MAEKGFGVKEVNLIGASGTPTITSPNNLNLNANNVAISTNVSIGGTLSVTGNVSVGGTLTYEDVTNIDSVGIITARAGVNLTGGNITLGDSGGSSDDRLVFGAGSDLQLMHDGAQSYIINATGNLDIRTGSNASDSIDLQSNAGGENMAKFIPGGAVELYHNNNKKLETSSSGATVTGTLAATAVTGDGSALTGITITPTNSDIQVAYTVTANGSSAYRFAGNGVVSTADNPDLYFIRGKKYRFINNSGGSHPFQIRESSGGTAYSTGVTNNGAASGNIDFAPTYDSPAQLVYQCTSHGGMVGNIYLRDAAGGNTKVGVSTFSGKVTIESSTQPTFNKGNFGPGSLTLQNNSNDGTIDYSQGIVFTDNANNDSDGGWVHGAIVCTGSTGYNGNMIFGIDGDGGRDNDLTGITDKMRILNDGRITTNGLDGATDITTTGTGDTYDGMILGKPPLRVTRTSGCPVFLNRNGSGGNIQEWRYGGSIVGYVSNTGNSLPSDRNYKKNITNLSLGLDLVNKLQPVSYHYKFDADSDPVMYGLVAQDVETALNDAGVAQNTAAILQYEAKNDVKESDYALDYSKLTPILINAVKELTKKVETLEAEVAALKAK